MPWSPLHHLHPIITSFPIVFVALVKYLQLSTICSAGGCGVPVTSSNSNAHLADMYITKTSFASGDTVNYTCDVGHIQAGGSRYRRCINGKWTTLRLKCERKPCGSAGEIANGQFMYSGVEFGDTAEAVCDEGHHLVGRATRTCTSRGWDGRVPVCEGAVTASFVKGRQEPPYTYRSAIRYRCSVGFLNGPREIWCTEDGTWSDSPTKCEEITCPSPKVPGAIWAGAPKKLYQFRDTLSIECYRGYRSTGPSDVTCGNDGRWYPGLPRCTRISFHEQTTITIQAIIHKTNQVAGKKLILGRGGLLGD
uniref:Sushi domain-containing protein n=1 Tax=Dicentrarchus labrax TaxID=13489 RepID=A0A8C4HQM5_DICLA